MIALLLVLSCGKADEAEALPPAVCEGPESPNRIFLERTAAWGLTGVEGVRIEAIDFDGDGWADLHVHRGGEAADDFAPGGVRQSWLLRNTGGTGFEDVTESSGFRTGRTGAPRPGSVVAWADVDNDGDLDAYTALSDPEEVLVETSDLVLNDGDGTFTLGPEDNMARRKEAADIPAGASFTDIDRDGLVDLWVPQNSVDYVPQQDELFAGNGDGSFDRITLTSGVETLPWDLVSDLDAGLSHSNAWSSLACDLDDDGWPELLAGSYGRAPNSLHHNLGGGSFENRSVPSGYAFDHRTDWADNESARCWCTLHPTDDECAGVPAPENIACNVDADAFRWSHSSDRAAYRLGGNSATAVCADVDNDGDRDLLTAEIVHWDVGSSSDPAELLLNDGTGVFERPGNEVTGLTREHDRVDWNDGDMTAAVFDFDNDMWPDVYVGSSDYPGARGHLWRQDAPGHFAEVPIEDGIDHFRSHGIATADFDRDGDLDVVVGHSLSRCDSDCYDTANVRLFLNGTGGNFVRFTLAGGPGSNAAAIGARVRVTAGGVTQTQEVGGGHGHYGMQSELTRHFGLGAACEAVVEVRWPDAAGTTETWTLPAGHDYVLTQGVSGPALAGCQ